MEQSLQLEGMILTVNTKCFQGMYMRNKCMECLSASFVFCLFVCLLVCYLWIIVAIDTTSLRLFFVVCTKE